MRFSRVDFKMCAFWEAFEKNCLQKMELSYSIDIGFYAFVHKMKR